MDNNNFTVQEIKLAMADGNRLLRLTTSISEFTGGYLEVEND